MLVQWGSHISPLELVRWLQRGLRPKARDHGAWMPWIEKVIWFIFQEIELRDILHQVFRYLRVLRHILSWLSSWSSRALAHRLSHHWSPRPSQNPCGNPFSATLSYLGAEVVMPICRAVASNNTVFPSRLLWLQPNLLRGWSLQPLSQVLNVIQLIIHSFQVWDLEGLVFWGEESLEHWVIVRAQIVIWGDKILSL